MKAMDLEISFPDLMRQGAELGFKTTDLLSFTLSFLSYMMAVSFYYFFAFTIRKPLEELLNHMSILEQKLEMSASGLRRKPKALTVFVVGIIILTTGISFLILGYLDQAIDFGSQPAWKLVPITMIWMYMNGIIFCLPTMMALIMLFIHLTGSVETMMTEFAGKMLTTDMTVGHAISSGSKVIEVLQSLEKTFSKFLVAEITFQMWMLMIGKICTQNLELLNSLLNWTTYAGIYFCFGLMPTMARLETLINLISISAMYQFMATYQSILKLSLLSNCGQSLANASTRLGVSMEKFYAGEAHKMSKNDIVQVESMIRLFGTKVPIRPLDLFDLKISSGLKAFSVLVTYIVIMLQFKLGEI